MNQKIFTKTKIVKQITPWFSCQMICRSLKAPTCCVKEWRRCRTTPARRSERRAVAGECSASENRTTRWTWRPLSHTRESSAMEVSDHSLCLSKTYRINSYKDVSCLHYSGMGFLSLIIIKGLFTHFHQTRQWLYCKFMKWCLVLFSK